MIRTTMKNILIEDLGEFPVRVGVAGYHLYKKGFSFYEINRLITVPLEMLKSAIIREVALLDLGYELSNNIGVAGRYLYHQGFSLDDIALAYGVRKSDLLLEILEVVREVKGLDWFMEKHIEACKLTEPWKYESD